MHTAALILVLLSAILHAAWNAQLKSGKNQAQFMSSMSLAVGAISLICVPLVGLPNVRSWPFIALSGALHILYNFLLLQKYKNADFSSAYPISRGVSPVLVSLGAFLFIRQHLALLSFAGIALISCGILLQVTGKNRLDFPLMLPAFATGATIAAYTVVDTMGVQRSDSTASYSVWIFASYLFVPALLQMFRFRVHLVDRASMPKALCAGVLSLIAYTVVLWATHYVAVGTVSALRETSVLWAAAIGRVFLGEDLTRRKIGSAVLICCGVILLVGSNTEKGVTQTSEVRPVVWRRFELEA
jgi:drug/metabolite transporter (DMT)-like permease